MDIKIIAKVPLADCEVAKIISDVGNKSDRAEIQNQVLGVITKFKRLKIDKAEKLKQELKAMNIATFTDEHIAAILNLLPRDLAELKSVFASSKTTIDAEHLQKMLETIKKYS